MENSLKILLLAESRTDRNLLRDLLLAKDGPPIEYREEAGLAAGLARLEQEKFDAVLFSLNLPDSRGLTTFFKLKAKAPQVPLVVLADIEEGSLGLEAVRRGAQDALIKNQLTRSILVQSLQAGIAHMKREDRIREMAFQDPLTKLFSRAGLAIVGGHQLRLSQRTKSPATLVFADINRLEDINQEFGYEEGDAALRDVADVMRKTFRASDLMARLDADEFVLLAPYCSEENAGKLIDRWTQNLRSYLNERKPRYALSLSLGHSAWDPEAPVSLDQLLIKGEWRMWKNMEEREERSRHES